MQARRGLRPIPLTPVPVGELTALPSPRSLSGNLQRSPDSLAGYGQGKEGRIMGIGRERKGRKRGGERREGREGSDPPSKSPGYGFEGKDRK